MDNSNLWAFEMLETWLRRGYHVYIEPSHYGVSLTIKLERYHLYFADTLPEAILQAINLSPEGLELSQAPYENILQEKEDSSQEP